MTDTFITIIGFIAAFGTTAAWLPQLRKTWVTGSARDFSWSYLCLLTSGVALWVVYGVMRRDAAVIAANVVTVVLVICVVWVKSRERSALLQAPDDAQRSECGLSSPPPSDVHVRRPFRGSQRR